MKKKVLVAMSGGVDSSTAAVLLKKEGYDVVGVTMKLLGGEVEDGGGRKLCCTAQDAMDARKVAHDYDFPFLVSNMTAPFEELVINNFIHEYSHGFTPNPCIQCNRYLKFGLLWERAQILNCDYIATGHYARIVQENGKYFIAKATDPTKDQSYFLFSILPEIVPHILFPVGHLTKPEVRQLATSFQLVTSQKPDSQDICFLKGQDYRTFIKDRLPGLTRQGQIVNTQGQVLGEHAGFFHYTIGQRKGLGIGYREPLYVLRIHPLKNEVVVGTRQEAFRTEFWAKNPNIFDETYFDGSKPLDIHPWYHSRPVPGTAKLEGTRLHIRLHKPKEGISPGQAVVAYAGDKVVGGGWIDRED